MIDISTSLFDRLREAADQSSEYRILLLEAAHRVAQLEQCEREWKRTAEFIHSRARGIADDLLRYL